MTAVLIFPVLHRRSATTTIATIPHQIMLLVVLTRVLASHAPLLLLLFVLTRVLAQLGLCVHCIVTHCLMIVPNSSLQYWRAFAVDKEPSSLVYNWNEDSFNGTPSSSLVAAHCSDLCSRTAWFVRALHRCTLSDDCSKLLTTVLARLCH